MLEIIRPGAQTTVQDLGRPGWEAMGIPIGGAVDRRAFVWANRLAGNHAGLAGLECLLSGPTIRLHQPALVATAGVTNPMLDGRSMPSWSGFEAPAGGLLTCETLTGARGYIAVAGGIDVPFIMGSRSTNVESGFGGWMGRGLVAGEHLPTGLASHHRPDVDPPPRPDNQADPLTARVVLGPRSDDFTLGEIAVFLDATFRMTPQSNHIGIRLEGPRIESLSRGDRLSEPMPVGGVQITPAGQPVILLAARGTMGGYPVIATVVTPDLWRLGQARPGERVRFSEISLERAQEITVRAQAELFGYKEL